MPSIDYCNLCEGCKRENVSNCWAICFFDDLSNMFYDDSVNYIKYIISSRHDFDRLDPLMHAIKYLPNKVELSRFLCKYIRNLKSKC